MLVPQRLLLGPIRTAVGVASDALSWFDAALTRVGPQAPEPVSGPSAESLATGDREGFSEKIIAVREARKLALDRHDAGLAGKLRAVERYLVHQQQRSKPEELLPVKLDRSSVDARLEDIRQRLLATAQRPDGAEEDD